MRGFTFTATATLALAIVGASLMPMPAALGQAGPGDLANGRRLSEQWCSECHVIDREQTRVPNAAVPTWPSIADNAATTEFRLRAFFQTPHQNMPNIALSRSQADDIITYILSLRSR